MQCGGSKASWQSVDPAGMPVPGMASTARPSLVAAFVAREAWLSLQGVRMTACHGSRIGWLIRLDCLVPGTCEGSSWGGVFCDWSRENLYTRVRGRNVVAVEAAVRQCHLEVLHQLLKVILVAAFLARV